MTGFKSYFRAHLKANRRTVIYILVISLVLTLIIALNNQVYERWDSSMGGYVNKYRSTIGAPVTFLCILTYVIPVMEFSFFKKRLNLNCAYSMPISRRNMGLVHYLTGAITLASAFTLSYLANLAVMLTHGSGHYVYAPMIAHYFLNLLLGLVMYTFFVFVFNEANTQGDGICFMYLWTFALLLVLACIQMMSDDYLLESIGAIPWGLVGDLNAAYQAVIEVDSTSEFSFWNNPDCTFWFTFWLIIGILSAVGLFLTFGKRRMEKTEEISDSFFGYRVMIPLYAITGNIIFEGLIGWIIVEIMALIGYTIYRRGFHYKTSDIIVLASMLLLLFI